MTIDNSVREQTTGEVDFRIFYRALWAARVRIVVICFVGAAVGAGIGWMRGREYEVKTVVSVSADGPGAGGLSGGIASQYSGLAAIAGIQLGGGGKRDEIVAVLKSQILTSLYIEDQNLLPVMYSDRWDGAILKWKPDVEVPTVWVASQYFDKKIRRVEDDRRSGLISVSITWTDPKTAARWANDLVRRTNEYLRTKAILETERNILYLNDQAASSTLVETRRAIGGLLEQEINKAMLAKGREEYALKVIDPAVPPERPSTRGIRFLTAVGFLLGGVTSLILVFGRRVVSFMIPE